MRQLQIFVALAEELNFTRTAERLHTVQSNVTSHVRHLEEELGAPLFDRYPRRLVLTDAGTRFLPYAMRVLATVDEGRRTIQFGDAPAGPLRIGAPESILTYRLPRALRRFRQHHPHVTLMLRPYVDWPLAAPLQNGEFDLAIRIADSVAEKTLGSRRIGAERIVLVAAPEHPLVERATVRPRDLAEQHLLLTEEGCAYRKKFERVLSTRGVKPHSVGEFASVEAIKQCATLGMGIALLPEIVVASEIRSGALRVLAWRGPDVSMATHVVWHKDRSMTPAMRGFLETLQEATKNG
ncbi:MAG TPA: LysR family transcriptional regulator [Thermoanaerobaculia bacterium]